MAKDDYHVLVFKILLYLYGCLKREITFDEVAFHEALIAERGSAPAINEGYLTDVLRLMMQSGLIEGLRFQKAWGNEYILLSELKDMRITAEGIGYLEDNSLMGKAKTFLLENGGSLITGLIGIVMGGS